MIQAIGENPNSIHDAKNEAYNMRRQGMHTAVDSATRSNNAAAAALKSMLQEVRYNTTHTHQEIIITPI